MLDSLHQKVLIFGTRELEIVETDLENQTLNLLMADLQQAGAAFSVAPDGAVQCNIGSVQAKGACYAIAGMRAGISVKP